MSCSSSSEKTIMVGGGRESGEIVELVKVHSIEDANRLLKDNHVFLSVYYNQAMSREEYILGKLEREERPGRSIGFKVDK